MKPYPLHVVFVSMANAVRSASLALLLLLFLPGNHFQLNAQPVPTDIASERAALPPSPIIVRLPPSSRWSITTSFLPAGSDGDAAIAELAAASLEKAASLIVRKVSVTRSGPLLVEITSTPDGMRTEKWCQGNLQVSLNKDWKAPLLVDGRNPYETGFTDYSKMDFHGLEWISAANFAGIRNLNGRTCWMFRDRVLPMTKKEFNDLGAELQAHPDKLKVGACAFVDTQTRLPIRFLRGSELMTYEYETPPSGPLQMPDAARKVIAEMEVRLQALRQPAPQPF